MSFAENKAKLAENYSMLRAPESDFVDKETFLRWTNFYKANGDETGLTNFKVRQMIAYEREDNRIFPIMCHYVTAGTTIDELKALYDHMMRRGMHPDVIADFILNWPLELALEKLEWVRL